MLIIEVLIIPPVWGGDSNTLRLRLVNTAILFSCNINKAKQIIKKFIIIPTVLV